MRLLGVSSTAELNTRHVGLTLGDSSWLIIHANENPGKYQQIEGFRV